MLALYIPYLAFLGGLQPEIETFKIMPILLRRINLLLPNRQSHYSKCYQCGISEKLIWKENIAKFKKIVVVYVKKNMEVEVNISY
jgi:hypothetical protein